MTTLLLPLLLLSYSTILAANDDTIKPWTSTEGRTNEHDSNVEGCVLIGFYTMIMYMFDKMFCEAKEWTMYIILYGMSMKSDI